MRGVGQALTAKVKKKKINKEAGKDSFSLLNWLRKENECNNLKVMISKLVLPSPPSSLILTEMMGAQKRLLFSSLVRHLLKWYVYRLVHLCSAWCVYKTLLKTSILLKQHSNKTLQCTWTLATLHLRTTTQTGVTFRPLFVECPFFIKD